MFPIVVQPMTRTDKQPIQQLVITSMPTTIQVTITLPIDIPRGSGHQPSVMRPQVPCVTQKGSKELDLRK
jgi:hypothetical protein